LSNLPKFHPNRLLTQEEIEVRVWASVVLLVTLILAGIVIFMLYSLAFVVQPIKSMAPIDQAFAKMLNDIVLLIVGGIGGVMSRKGVQAVADKISPPVITPAPVAATPVVAPVVLVTLYLYGLTLLLMRSGEHLLLLQQLQTLLILLKKRLHMRELLLGVRHD